MGSIIARHPGQAVQITTSLFWEPRFEQGGEGRSDWGHPLNDKFGTQCLDNEGLKLRCVKEGGKMGRRQKLLDNGKDKAQRITKTDQGGKTRGSLRGSGEFSKSDQKQQQGLGEGIKALHGHAHRGTDRQETSIGFWG